MMKKRTHMILMIKMVTVMLLRPVLVQIHGLTRPGEAYCMKGNVCGS
jgi:hypothetical protein